MEKCICCKNEIKISGFEVSYLLKGKRKYEDGKICVKCVDVALLDYLHKQRIEPPQDVQDSMNEVVKAEQERIAAG